VGVDDELKLPEVSTGHSFSDPEEKSEKHHRVFHAREREFSVPRRRRPQGLLNTAADLDDAIPPVLGKPT
jgi:hypothetical protein